MADVEERREPGETLSGKNAPQALRQMLHQAGVHPGPHLKEIERAL